MRESILVCSSIFGTSKLLEQRIRSHFSNLLKSKKVIGIQELGETAIEDELVISTMPILHVDYPVINVSPLIMDKDKKNMKYLNQGVKDDSKVTFFSMGRNESKEVVLKKITDHLID